MVERIGDRDRRGGSREGESKTDNSSGVELHDDIFE
jgi:hypothetical protein